MALTEAKVTCFADYYNSLVNREVSIEEQLLRVIRLERAERRKVQNDQCAAFRDVLFIVGHWIGDKKVGVAAHFGSRYVSMDEYMTWKKEREIWFPRVPPKEVPVRKAPIVRAFPFAKVASLIHEETQLRNWLIGVREQKMNRLNAFKRHQLFLLECRHHLQAREVRERWRMEKDELEARAALKKKAFLDAPSSFFVQQLQERFGGTEGIQKPPTFEESEQLHRMGIEGEERTAWEKVKRLPLEVCENKIFTIRHQEVIQRDKLIEDEAAKLYQLVAHACRRTFGLCFYHIPVLALHVSPSRCPLLTEMVKSTALFFPFRGLKYCTQAEKVNIVTQKRNTVAPSSLEVSCPPRSFDSSMGDDAKPRTEEDMQENAVQHNGEPPPQVDPNFALSPYPISSGTKFTTDPSWFLVDEMNPATSSPIFENNEKKIKPISANFPPSSLSVLKPVNHKKSRENRESYLRSVGCNAILPRDSNALLSLSHASYSPHSSKPPAPLVKAACWTSLADFLKNRETQHNKSSTQISSRHFSSAHVPHFQAAQEHCLTHSSTSTDGQHSLYASSSPITQSPHSIPVVNRKLPPLSAAPAPAAASPPLQVSSTPVSSLNELDQRRIPSTQLDGIRARGLQRVKGSAAVEDSSRIDIRKKDSVKIYGQSVRKGMARKNDCSSGSKDAHLFYSDDSSLPLITKYPPPGFQKTLERSHEQKPRGRTVEREETPHGSSNLRFPTIARRGYKEPFRYTPSIAVRVQ